MHEEFDTFISKDESGDSLEPRFSGLSVCVSFTLRAWMTELGYRGAGIFHVTEGFA